VIAMRVLLIAVALLLSGCYPTHWRNTPFCGYCLGDRSAPACQAACNMAHPVLIPRPPDALRDARDKAFMAWADCKMTKGRPQALGGDPCWAELQAWGKAETAYWSRRND